MDILTGMSTQTLTDGFTKTYTYNAANGCWRSAKDSVKKNPNINMLETYTYDANGNRIGFQDGWMKMIKTPWLTARITPLTGKPADTGVGLPTGQKRPECAHRPGSHRHRIRRRRQTDGANYDPKSNAIKVWTNARNTCLTT
ncbi:MAG: hypothetical protein R2941_02095 [Desulfobacterales bacterium]